MSNRIVFLALNSGKQTIYDVINFNKLRLKTDDHFMPMMEYDRIYKDFICFKSIELTQIWHDIWNTDNDFSIVIVGHETIETISKNIIFFFLKNLNRYFINKKKYKNWFGLSTCDIKGKIQNVTTPKDPTPFALAKFDKINSIEKHFKKDMEIVSKDIDVLSKAIIISLGLTKKSRKQTIRLINLPSLKYFSNINEGAGKLLHQTQFTLYAQRVSLDVDYSTHPLLDIIRKKTEFYNRQILVLLSSSSVDPISIHKEVIYGMGLLHGSVSLISKPEHFSKNIFNPTELKKTCLQLHNNNFKLIQDQNLLKKENIKLRQKEKKYRYSQKESKSMINRLQFQLHNFKEKIPNLEKNAILKGRYFAFEETKKNIQLGKEKGKREKLQTLQESLRNQILYFKLKIENKLKIRYETNKTISKKLQIANKNIKILKRRTEGQQKVIEQFTKYRKITERATNNLKRISIRKKDQFMKLIKKFEDCQMKLNLLEKEKTKQNIKLKKITFEKEDIKNKLEIIKKDFRKGWEKLNEENISLKSYKQQQQCNFEKKEKENITKKFEYEKDRYKIITKHIQESKKLERKLNIQQYNSLSQFKSELKSKFSELHLTHKEIEKEWSEQVSKLSMRVKYLKKSMSSLQKQDLKEYNKMFKLKFEYIQKKYNKIIINEEMRIKQLNTLNSKCIGTEYQLNKKCLEIRELKQDYNKERQHFKDVLYKLKSEIIESNFLLKKKKNIEKELENYEKSFSLLRADVYKIQQEMTKQLEERRKETEKNKIQLQILQKNIWVLEDDKKELEIRHIDLQTRHKALKDTYSSISSEFNLREKRKEKELLKLSIQIQDQESKLRQFKNRKQLKLLILNKRIKQKIEEKWIDEKQRHNTLKYEKKKIIYKMKKTETIRKQQISNLNDLILNKGNEIQGIEEYNKYIILIKTEMTNLKIQHNNLNNTIKHLINDKHYLKIENKKLFENIRMIQSNSENINYCIIQERDGLLKEREKLQICLNERKGEIYKGKYIEKIEYEINKYLRLKSHLMKIENKLHKKDEKRKKIQCQYQQLIRNLKHELENVKFKNQTLIQFEKNNNYIENNEVKSFFELQKKYDNKIEVFKNQKKKDTKLIKELLDDKNLLKKQLLKRCKQIKKNLTQLQKTENVMKIYIKQSEKEIKQNKSREIKRNEKMNEIKTLKEQIIKSKRRQREINEKFRNATNKFKHPLEQIQSLLINNSIISKDCILKKQNKEQIITIMNKVLNNNQNNQIKRLKNQIQKIQNQNNDKIYNKWEETNRCLNFVQTCLRKFEIIGKRQTLIKISESELSLYFQKNVGVISNTENNRNFQINNKKNHDQFKNLNSKHSLNSIMNNNLNEVKLANSKSKFVEHKMKKRRLNSKVYKSPLSMENYSVDHSKILSKLRQSKQVKKNS